MISGRGLRTVRSMGAMALLVDGAAGGAAIALQAAARLAGLGVTRVSILGDTRGTAIILEGWAFDPDLSGDEVEQAVCGASNGVRRLAQVANVSLTGPVAGAAT